MNLIQHLKRQHTASITLFGPGARSQGIVKHIKEELDEILAAPSDLEEWVDVMILAFDGALREGHTPEDIAAGIIKKQAKNESRNWPDYRNYEVDEPIPHIPPTPEGCYPIGTIIRHGTGPTELMRVDGTWWIGRTPERVYSGKHCQGCDYVAHESECSLATEEDIKLWRKIRK